MSSSTMALARALTKRARRQHEDSSDGSYKYAAGTIQRSKISLPTELISTTNVHALSAPDVRSASNTSSSSSVRSGDDSDLSPASERSLRTPATSPDTSSIESTPTSPDNGSRKFFSNGSTPKRSATIITRSSSGTSSSSDSTPALPKRDRSHSKKAHQDLARKRSMSRLTPPPTVMANATVIRSSADMFSPGITDPDHPFGRELAQVNEVAEEFGGVTAYLGEEEEMRIKGLIKFDANDYVNEILGLWDGRFNGEMTALASPWI